MKKFFRQKFLAMQNILATEEMKVAIDPMIKLFDGVRSTTQVAYRIRITGIFEDLS